MYSCDLYSCAIKGAVRGRRNAHEQRPPSGGNVCASFWPWTCIILVRPRAALPAGRRTRRRLDRGRRPTRIFVDAYGYVPWPGRRGSDVGGSVVAVSIALLPVLLTCRIFEHLCACASIHNALRSSKGLDGVMTIFLSIKNNTHLPHSIIRTMVDLLYVRRGEVT